MIEIVFSDSACGSLKLARNYGKGNGVATAIFLRHQDDKDPTAEEIQEAQLRAEKDARFSWENAIPLGGESGDVYCFDIALSVGDISDDGLGEQRKSVLRSMLSICPFDDLEHQIEEKMLKSKTALSSVMERYIKGEEIRIWYSYNPDELCGMYWLMAQLWPLNCQTAINCVKLPVWDYGKANTIISRNAWGEIAPGEWGKYTSCQEKVRPELISAYAMKWRQLQEENAPLRVMLNGQLQSVPEDFYDSFIVREIATQPEQFKMAIVIGNVIGKYQLGIGDAWVSFRIEKMIHNGILEIVQDTPENDISYCRILRKRK